MWERPKMVDKHVRLYSLFRNYNISSFIWVTSTSPQPHPLPFASWLCPLPPQPSPPKSFCNVIDYILRKCIYFQIKYLFKELLHVWALWWGDNAKILPLQQTKKLIYRNTEGHDRLFLTLLPPPRVAADTKSGKGHCSWTDTPSEDNAGYTI